LIIRKQEKGQYLIEDEMPPKQKTTQRQQRMKKEEQKSHVSKTSLTLGSLRPAERACSPTQGDTEGYGVPPQRKKTPKRSEAGYRQCGVPNQRTIDAYPRGTDLGVKEKRGPKQCELRDKRLSVLPPSPGLIKSVGALVLGEN